MFGVFSFLFSYLYHTICNRCVIMPVFVLYVAAIFFTLHDTLIASVAAASSSDENLTNLFFDILSKKPASAETKKNVPRTKLTESEKDALNVLMNGFRNRVFGRVGSRRTTTVGPTKDRAENVDDRGAIAKNRVAAKTTDDDHVVGRSAPAPETRKGPTKPPKSGNPTGRPRSSAGPFASRLQRIIDLLDRPDGRGVDEAIETMMNVRGPIVLDAKCPFDTDVDDRALMESISTGLERLHRLES